MAKNYRRRKRIKRITHKILVYTLIVVFSLAFLLPFFWMLSTSFKKYDEIFSIPISFIPKEWIWTNYADVFESSEYVNILVGLRNTLIIVIPSTIIGTLTAALAGFAFAKVPFKGRSPIFFALISTMAIPGIITMIPTYILFSKIGWVNTWFPLMIPGMFGGAGAIFFTRQYMKTIPREIAEAARVDGLSWWGIFWRIYLPLSKPIIISNLLFGFIGGYNDWLGPTLYLNTDANAKTLQQMIAMLNDTFGTRWGIQMAGSCLALIPTFIIFVVCQKFFIQGVNLNAGKDDA
ncbi:MAG: carbohydrate ABC transporter permease [Bacilli bacterium]|nr:carbohydrate ABC transporter permease [Bacilli bacterium]